MTTENPPAFPLGVPHMTEYQPEWGMTLRDYFAGQALAGLLANPSLDSLKTDEWASDAYILADAMLAARSQDSAS